MYANGMSISFHSEPHVLAGTVTPTIGRCNISLPMENGLNSIEWRLRKEQIKGKVTVFGRKLRVSRICHYNNDLFFCGQTILHFEGCLSYFYLLKMYKSGIVFSMTIFSLRGQLTAWDHLLQSAIEASLLKVFPKRLVKIQGILLQVTLLLKVGEKENLTTCHF